MILIRPNICAMLMVCSGLTNASDSAQKFEKNEVLQRALLLEAIKVHKLSFQVWEKDDFYDMWEVAVAHHYEFVPPDAPRRKDAPARRFLFYG